jgi:hypothetical protein
VQTTGDLPNYDEPLDIRKLSYENIDVICEIAGRSRRALEQELVAAHSHGREVWVLVNNPLFVRNKPKRDSCYYDHKWNEETGWSQICAVHKKPTWHDFRDNENPPCIAIDPKPVD